jgi:hypothetical protein
VEFTETVLQAAADGVVLPVAPTVLPHIPQRVAFIRQDTGGESRFLEGKITGSGRFQAPLEPRRATFPQNRGWTSRFLAKIGGIPVEFL